MAISTLSGSYIDETYGRLVQTNGSEFADGLGNPISFGAGNAAGPIDSIQINRDGSNFTGSANLKFVNNNIQLTGSILMSGSSYIAGVDYIDFDTTTPAPAQNEGRLFWNVDSKTLQLDLEQNFHTDLNQQMLVRVVNKTGTDIPIGHVVFISGSQGNRPGIKLASYESDATSAATVGFTAKDINHNNNGYVITRGILDGLNTSAFAVGDRLFLSSSGDFTNIVPDAPLHEVRLGKVIVSDATNGSIYVDIMNGYELDELHDVKATNPNYGDLFMYSGSLWTATKTLSGSYVLSGSLTTNDGVTVNTLTASAISASSIVGYVANTQTSSMLQPYVLSTQTGSMTIQNLTVTGTASIQYLTVLYETASIIYSSGSNQLGDATNDTQTLIGTVIVSGSQRITGSLNVTGGITASLQGTASWSTNAITSYTPISTTGSTIYSTSPATSNVNPANGIFLGSNAGGGAINADYGVFLGYSAGQGATIANESIFIGPLTGTGAVKADHSVFIGTGAGRNAVSASYSTIIGAYAGWAPTPSTGVGTNNIIIGNYVTLPDNARNSINIGGLIFATGSYSSFGTVFSGSMMGKVGINNSNPQYNFDVSGSGRFTNGLTVTGSFTQSGSNATFVGNVGIGTTSPAYKLDVSGSTNLNLNNISTFLRLQSGTNEKHSYIQTAYSNLLLLNNARYTNSGFIYDQNGASTQIQIAPTGINFYVAPAGLSNANISYTTAITIGADAEVKLPSLTNSSQANVVGVDPATGQLYYQSARGTAASLDEINTGTGTNVVEPENLEQSKYTTINIFNYLNFS